ncbi:NAD(P)H-hydrate dehydratase [Neisseria weaveri]|uniref:ADP-dependent (S)-NAD(P)H-hydrate dehydratase n=1 Tax=Neisseria weaveri TaxID=28091 RepID=A0A3S4ZAF5_9NEIS|nr:YjeF protein [Neisseria weaveri LMG 5135]VEJ51879.1 putative carbohydrate kinase [Neisseria weaveri]
MMFSSYYKTCFLDRQLSEASAFPEVFSRRDADSHKGTYGTLAVVGGAAGMSGAVVMASVAAMYNGCGKVWAGFNQKSLPLPVIPERPEVMLDTAPNLLMRDDIGAWVVGCGLGVDEESVRCVSAVLSFEKRQPVLLDADALNVLAKDKHLNQTACAYSGGLVLTPHPAEAARLLACTTAEVQADRLAAVQKLAEHFSAFVVLKGHKSLVCTPDGEVYTNHSGNAGLATAGSGDVLSGLIGSLLAQGIQTKQAVCGGVWLHGAAADVLRDSEIGETGMLAGELAPAARWLRNRLIREFESLA